MDVRALTISFAMLALSLLFASSAQAGEPLRDLHLTTDPAHELYAISAFAHGQRHGYENGFHDADVDVHMARGNQLPQEDAVKVKDFDPTFGDQLLFDQGYRAGYIVGYGDSYAGRTFRPTTILQSLRMSLPARPGGPFQQGVARGYEAGANIRVNVSVPDLWAHYALQHCPQAGNHSDDFCSGYAWGYLLGTIYHSEPAEPVLQVRARR